MKLLAKIIPLLSSDQPGEVAAAAAAIGRVLGQHGRDWHWLASLAAGGASHAPSAPQDAALAPLRQQVAALARDLGRVRQENIRLRDEAHQLRRDCAALRARVNKPREYATFRQGKPPPPHPTKPSRGRWVERAQIIRDDHRFGLSPGNRLFMEGIRIQAENIRGFEPSSQDAARFERIWKNYRMRSEE